jgi:hypothetical protein
MIYTGCEHTPVKTEINTKENKPEQGAEIPDIVPYHYNKKPV